MYLLVLKMYACLSSMHGDMRFYLLLDLKTQHCEDSKHDNWTSIELQHDYVKHLSLWICFGLIVYL